MPDVHKWQKTLLNAAEARGITLSAADLEVVHQSDDHSPLAQWVKTTLNTSRLLSSEELKIIKYMEQKNRHGSSSENASDAVDIPQDELSLHQAIESLEASTATIEIHANILERQKLCLNAYQERNVGASADPSLFPRSLQRKREGEAQQLKIVNAKALVEVELKLNLIQEKAEKALKTIPSMISERLNSDDRILDNLEQQSAHSVTAAEPSFSDQQDRIDNLLTALQNATTLSLKDRLDRVYLQELQTLTADDSLESHNNATQKDLSQVKEDLEVLYTEIDDVAAMLIQHEHGHQLNKALRAFTLYSTRQQSENRHELYDKISSMTRNLNDLAQRYESLRSHRIVVQHMQAKLAHIAKDKHQRVVSTTTSSSAAPTSRQSNDSSGNNNTNQSIDPNMPALTALLQHLNITSDLNTAINPTNHSEHKPNPAIVISDLNQASTNLRQEINRTTSDIQSCITKAANHRTRQVQSLLPRQHVSISGNSNTGQTADNPTTATSAVAEPEAEDNEDETNVLYSEQIELIQTLDQMTMKSKVDVERIHDVKNGDDESALARTAFIQKWRGR